MPRKCKSREPERIPPIFGFFPCWSLDFDSRSAHAEKASSKRPAAPPPFRPGPSKHGRRQRLSGIIRYCRRYRHHCPPHASTNAAALTRHHIHPTESWRALTVGLLETGTGTWTAELLGLTATVVGNEEGTVERGEGLLQQVLGVLIDEPRIRESVAASRGISLGDVDRTSGCRRSGPWRWPDAQRCPYVSTLYVTNVGPIASAASTVPWDEETA